MRQILRQQNSDDHLQSPLIFIQSQDENQKDPKDFRLTNDYEGNSQQGSGFLITQLPNVRNQSHNQHLMDQNLDQIVDKIGSSQFSHKCGIASKNNNIQVVRPPKNLAQFQICSRIGLNPHSIKSDSIMDKKIHANKDIQFSYLELEQQKQKAQQKSHLKLFSIQTSSKKRTQVLLNDMKSTTTQQQEGKIVKSMPSRIKRNLGLMPNLQILDSVQHSKKISKQKLNLRRVQTKQKLNLLKIEPKPQVFPLSQPCEKDEKISEVQNNQTNIVVSHIENFVHRKNRKELDKKLLINMKRQLLRNSVIRQKKVMATNPRKGQNQNQTKQITIQEKSFLDVTSLWNTDQNQPKEDQSQIDLQRISDNQQAESAVQIRHNTIQEDCFSLNSNSEAYLCFSQSQVSNLNQKDIDEKDEIDRIISEYQANGSNNLATNLFQSPQQLNPEDQHDLRQVDHYTPQIGLREKLQSDIEAFDTLPQKKNGFFDAQFNSTNISTTIQGQRKLDFEEEIPNELEEQQWSEEESDVCLNNLMN